jgi:DNA-directed RNA polymerase subunit K/omega
MESKTEITFNKIAKDYDVSKNKSKNIMTKYEYTQCLGSRMEQLTFGSPSTLTKSEISKFNNVKDIAKEELRQKIIPFVICRTMPDGKQEYWRIQDMIIMQS